MDIIDLITKLESNNGVLRQRERKYAITFENKTEYFSNWSTANKKIAELIESNTAVLVEKYFDVEFYSRK